MADDTPIGRASSHEGDALRLLTLVHQLGRPVEERGFAAEIAGELHLSRLGHLLAQPLDLAYFLVDRGRESERRSSAMRTVRRLLGSEREGESHRRHRFDPGGWRRLDEALSLAICRGLLEVQPAEEGAGTRYLLTDAGASFLEERIYPVLGSYLERSAALRIHLGETTPAELERLLDELEKRLERFRHDEQIPLEEDLLPHFFAATFGEPL